jgi:hypothetical protein
MDARAALAEKGEGNEGKKTEPVAQTVTQANGQPAAQKREQDAIRSEHKRRVAGGDV